MRRQSTCPSAPTRTRRASGQGLRNAGFARDIAEPLLKRLGWTVGPASDNTVDAVVCADDVAAGRPAPYMIFRAMEEAGVLDVARVAVAGVTAVTTQPTRPGRRWRSVCGRPCVCRRRSPHPASPWRRVRWHP